MATITENTYLMHYEGDEWVKLIDIKEFPDLGSSPDTVDITTLSNHMKTYIYDIQDPGSLEFSANFDKDDYTKVKALEKKTEHYAVWFGASADTEPTGSEGKFFFDGELSAWPKGGGVSAVREMGIAIAPATDIVQEDKYTTA